MDTARSSALLGGTELFGGLDQASLERLAEMTVSRSLDKGQTLFREGDPGEALYIVVEGLVKITVSSGDGSEMVLATLGPPRSSESSR